MKALQKNKRTIQQNGKSKVTKNGKNPSGKKTQKIDLINTMIFSEYDVWPILAEMNNRRN